MTEPCREGSFRSDEQHPFDGEYSDEQILTLLEQLGPEPRSVLELGCGTGRILAPLLEAGHRVLGIDRDPAALAACRQALGPAGEDDAWRLLLADFFDPWPEGLGDFDVVCCLGNTFMTVADVDQAAALLRRATRVLVPGGAFIMDDCPHQCWPELTEGRWLSGTAEDGSAQLIWDSADAVFVLRTGAEVDPDCWSFKPGDAGCVCGRWGRCGCSRPRQAYRLRSRPCAGACWSCTSRGADRPRMRSMA